MQGRSKKRIRPLSLFVLAMMNTAVVVGLEGLTEVGSFGLPLIVYYAVFTLIFFLPVGLVAAELGVGWPHDGGIYRWIREALGERWAFVGIWCQWVQIIIWYPTVLAVCAVSVAYVIDPALRDLIVVFGHQCRSCQRERPSFLPRRQPRRVDHTAEQ